ncbi:MAG TPA: glycosyltransferase family 2 protein, partial [Actinomycetota bacterium]|nr:glycosyltransferase family 2 protein [Actinomycetota bacterium]
TILLAERGRRRADGAGRWPVAAALLSPLWVAERAICSWIAVGHRILGGGIRYGDARLKVAANSRCRIRSRLERSRP